MDLSGTVDDLMALFHSIVGAFAQWCCLLLALALLVVVLCIGFTLLIFIADQGSVELPVEPHGEDREGYRIMDRNRNGFS